MKVIINADDYGMTASANRAIEELAAAGAVTSTTVMVNMPHAQEAVRLVQHEHLGIGLHVTLTQGEPVSPPHRIPSLVNRDGLFLGKRGLQRAMTLRRVRRRHVQIELEAQYRLLRDLVGDRLDHLDSHQGVNKYALVSGALIELSKGVRRRLGLRVYNKYYLSRSSGGVRVVHPRLRNVLQFGARRTAVEAVLRLRTRWLERHFVHPDGLLMTRSHRTLDLLEELHNVDRSDLPACVVEIACHPATDTVGLPETKLKETRIMEYELMRSAEFVRRVGALSPTTYAGLARS